MKLSRPASLFLAVGSAIGNWVIFYLVARQFGSIDPIFIATSLVLAVGIHELGHWLVLELNGVKTHIVFAVIGGGAIPDKRFEKVMKKLHWNSLAKVMIAGVAGNFLLLGISYLFYIAGWMTAVNPSKTVNLCGIMVFYNMFPFWITDGGRFAKIFFDSSPEHMDGKWVVRILIPIVIAAIYLSTLSPEFFLFTIPMMLWGLHFQATHDDPQGSYSPLALSKKQRINWAFIYLFVFIGSMFCLSYSERLMS